MILRRASHDRGGRREVPDRPGPVRKLRPPGRSQPRRAAVAPRARPRAPSDHVLPRRRVSLPHPYRGDAHDHAARVNRRAVAAHPLPRDGRRAFPHPLLQGPEATRRGRLARRHEAPEVAEARRERPRTASSVALDIRCPRVRAGGNVLPMRRCCAPTTIRSARRGFVLGGRCAHPNAGRRILP